MGGVLNEDVDGADVPVDVRDDLRRLGVEIPRPSTTSSSPSARCAARRPAECGVVALSDFGSTFTKVTLVEEGTGRLLAQAHHPTTIDTDVMDGYRDRPRRGDGAARRAGRRSCSSSPRRAPAVGCGWPPSASSTCSPPTPDGRPRSTPGAKVELVARRRSRRVRPGSDRRGAPGGAAVLRRHGRRAAPEGARQRRRRGCRRRPRARRRRLQRRHRVGRSPESSADPGGPSTSSPTSCRRSTGSTSSRRGRRSTTCSSITSSAASG